MPRTAVATADPSPVEALVRVRLASRTGPELFETWLLDRPAVAGVWSLTGDFDYEVRLACPDLEGLTGELRAMRQCGAEQTDTCLLLREIVAADPGC
jgi:hypothetical protein